ncbi:MULTISPECIES: cysteine hydrolase family protein [unclassified Psychrobacter]|uniref:cysteine hydrolase family protein n=1 Tax=unclassified Psychrobacter TaxID=196806 RepID=UPI0025B4003A|nr:MULTISPECIES: cysteine hydrolase family protein [unclassified Psychrobacter]MDN3452857.1 cysteine hydrolase family protein [Psychrobacter sp. APC 3350]MDN3502556.1 cysteine hydrolase family protein [Psychrobacter sp. 5A.1]
MYKTTSTPATLLELAGGTFDTLDWSNCAIVLIDYQNEYVDGAMPLGQACTNAIANARLLLDKARAQAIPVFHIAHHGEDNGNVFDPLSSNVEIIEQLQPHDGETVITKKHPNSFHDTQLQALITAAQKKQIIFAGFMSHMCVSSTARAAFDLGFDSFVCHDACATRDLPSATRDTISAEVMHDTAMAALQDRFAAMVTTDELVNG